MTLLSSIKAAPTAPAARTVKFTKASSIIAACVDWLWHLRVPVGMFGLLGCREGIGKSLTLIDMTAQITRGRLKGKYIGKPRNVMISASEDSWSHIIVPRLMAAGADLDRVERVEIETVVGLAELSLPKDLDGLKQNLISRADDDQVVLFIMDPLLSTLEGRLDTHKDAQVRTPLHPLVALADETGMSIIGIIHVNKSQGTDPLNTLMGSRAFSAVSRFVLFAIEDPQDESKTLLGQVETIITKRTTGDTRAVANASINRELAVLRRGFTLAIKAGVLASMPSISMLKEAAARSGFFEADALASVLAHLPDDLTPVIQFAAVTGWRIQSEVLPLEWPQVDFQAGEVRLMAGTTKNGDGRVFPMTIELRRILEARDRERERLRKLGHITPLVFFRVVENGPSGKPEPMPIKSFRATWKKACTAAGRPGAIPHDLRRTAVRNLVRAGITERVAMMMTGHKTRSVFERYNIVSDGDLHEASAKLNSVALLKAESA
jgi:integrase